MQKITLQIADNGVVKTIYDDNINGAGEEFESTIVYDFDELENKLKFIKDLSIDIGLEFGNSRSRHQIQVQTGWGQHYDPTPEEAKEKIEQLKAQIEQLSQTKDA
jgi:hypothetical protein